MQRVFASPHNDDAAHGVAIAVKVSDATADFRPQRDGTEILHKDGRSLFVRPNDDFFDVANALNITSSTDHVFRPGEFYQSAAHVIIAVSNRLDYRGDRNVEGQQFCGVNVDLILLLKTADRGHFGHAGHGLKLIAEIPVLERS